MRNRILVFCFLLMTVFLLNSCSSDTKQNLGSGYFLVYDKENPENSKVVHGKDNNFEDVILGEIMDFDIDPNFILIHRKVTEKARTYFEESPLWKKQLRDIDQYWIIEKQFDGINGPLNMKEYLAKRKELNISPGVKIRK